MTRILHLIFDRKRTIITLFLLVFAYGIYSYFVIPKQDMPEIDPPYMVISITAPSVNAKDMKKEILDDIEKVVLTFEDVTDVDTTIYDNFSYMIVSMSYSTPKPGDLSKQIFDKINELELSENISSMTYSSNFDDPHIIYALHSDTLSEIELLDYASALKNDLILLDEIHEVLIDSVFQKEVVITLDQTLLDTYGLDISEIYQLLYANAINIPLGGINTIYGTISITGNTDINQLSDLESITVIPEIPTISDEVRLSDLGTIELKDTSKKIYEFNGEKAVFVSVRFSKDIDFTKLGDTVTTIKNDFLSETNNEIEIGEMLFLPDYVESQINSVFYSLLLAIGVVLIVVFIGIGFRNSLLIIITFPLIIFGTVGILYISNFELHKLTIVGLIVAIGILVDNSIVITEGIKRNIDTGMPKVEGAKQAIRDNFWPVLSSTLTTIAAFIVIVLLPGFLGKIVSSMPLTVIIAISLSYVVSMVLSPLLAVIFLKKSKRKKAHASVHEKNIKKMIGFIIKYPMIWILVSIITLVGVVYYAFSTLPLDLYPNDERSVLYIDFENEELGSLESSKTLSDSIINIIKEESSLEGYAASIGGDLPNFHFSARYMNDLSHLGRIYIDLDMDEEQLLDYKKILEEECASIEGAKITVNVLELSPPVPDLRVTLSANTPEELDLLSASIFTEIKELDEVKTYTITQNLQSPKYVVHYDFDAISAAYLTKAQVASTIAYTLNGFDLEIFSFNEEIINVSLHTDIVDVTALLDITVYSEILDSDIPLHTLITIEEVIDYTVIHRQNNSDVSFMDLYYSDDATLSELEQKVMDIISEYELGDVTVKYSGENSMFEEISEDLIRASIIAIILIYIIMFIQFNNFVKPLIVYATIPLSFTGSFLFLLLFNTPITATSLIGMVSLIGVTVNNGILLVEYISRRHKEGMYVKEACIESVYLRFRPIMLTSLTTILGLIPLLLNGGNFFRPLAITFMGGMVSSTLLTLFIVPSIYYLMYKPEKFQA